MMSKRTVLTGIIALLVAAGAATAQIDLSAKDTIKYLQGSWVTEYEFPGMGTVREEATYSPGEEANTLKVEFKVFSGGQQIDSGEGTVKYDPATNTISSATKSETTGAVYESHEVGREGAVTWMEGTSKDPMMARYRIRIVADSKSAHTWTMYMPVGDGWKELLTCTYTRTK